MANPNGHVASLTPFTSETGRAAALVHFAYPKAPPELDEEGQV